MFDARKPFHQRFIAISLLLFALGPGIHAADTPASDAPKPGEPTDTKARKTFAEAIELEKKGESGWALEAFRKANKQDGGHCTKCLTRAYFNAYRIGDYKDAEVIARELLLFVADGEKASIHWVLANALQRQGINGKKERQLAESCDEYNAALALRPDLTTMRYSLGVSLAYLHRDEEARKEFSAFLDQDRMSPELHDRVKRFVGRIELARATMVPPFSLTTLDGQRVSMDGLAGKVVLIDFWATWCGPCREALPNIRKIAQKFDGQPFVVLSISQDTDQSKWKEFVAQNGMTWLQYCDGGFPGPIAKQFNVNAIPATFTIDADGVLEDQHIGDADIEGKLKKLIVRAVEVAKRKPAPAAVDKSARGTD